MKIFIFIAAVSGTFIGRNVSNYAYNPACPTENAAINCENDCISANVACIQNCGGSQGMAELLLFAMLKRYLLFIHLVLQGL